MPLSEPDAAFLADRNLTFLFARRPDGSPAGFLMTSVLTGDGLTFSTYAKSAKVRACLAAGQATALVIRRADEPDAPRRHQRVLRQAAGTARLTALPWPAKHMSSIIQ